MSNLSSLLREKRCCRALFTTVLMCLDHDSLLVMWTPWNLKLSIRSTSVPLMSMGRLFGHPFPVVHCRLLCLDYIEREVVVLAPHCQVSDLLLIGCLIIVGDQAYHACVVNKLNDGLESCLAMQSWVNREHRRELSTHP